MRTYLLIIFPLLILFVGSSTSAQSIQAGLSTGHLVRGEATIYSISIIDVKPTEIPIIPKLDRLILRPVNGGRPNTEIQIVNGKRSAYYEFLYQVQTLDEGPLRIPSIEVPIEGNGILKSAPMDLIVHPKSKLSWHNTKIGNYDCTYATALFTDDDTPFESQAIGAEYKIYVPGELPIAAWGPMEVEKENLLAHRFDAQAGQGNVARLNNKQYAVGSYRSVLTPTKSGSARLGPSTATINVVVRRGRGGFFNRDSIPVKMDFDSHTLRVQALPPGAPPNFKGLVGDFELNSSAKLEELNSGDPINVDLEVRGIGNFSALKTPLLTDESGWKLYPATQTEDSDSRLSLFGTAQFTQIVRPLEPKSSIPPFALTFFNPKTRTYETAKSRPIALPEALSKVFPKTTAAATSTFSGATTAIAQNKDMPTESLKGVLGFLPQNISNKSIGYIDAAKRSESTSWLWQIIPALLTLVLFGNAIRRRMEIAAMKNPELTLKRNQLQKIESSSADDATFFKQVNNYITRWIDQPDEETQAIIDEGERACFAPEDQHTRTDNTRRSKIISLLKAKTLLLLFSLSLFSSKQNLHAQDQGDALPSPAQVITKAQEEFKEGNYPAATLYNLGVAYHKQGLNGKAQLMFRRALIADKKMNEAQQNLRFLSKQGGAVIPGRDTWRNSLSVFSEQTWKNIVTSSIWLCIIALLLIIFYREKRILGIILLFFGILLTSFSVFAKFSRPDFPEKAPLSERAIVIADDISARTDASESSESVIETPAGTLCRLLARRGSWSYVAIGDNTRGWIPSPAIELLIPEKEASDS